jgi:hypothetical protein
MLHCRRNEICGGRNGEKRGTRQREGALGGEGGGEREEERGREGKYRQ